MQPDAEEEDAGGEAVGERQDAEADEGADLRGLLVGHALGIDLFGRRDGAAVAEDVVDGERACGPEESGCGGLQGRDSGHVGDDAEDGDDFDECHEEAEEIFCKEDVAEAHWGKEIEL